MQAEPHSSGERRTPSSFSATVTESTLSDRMNFGTDTLVSAPPEKVKAFNQLTKNSFSPIHVPKDALGDSPNP